MRPLTLRTVLAATDLDRSSDVAIDAAHRLAQAAGAALHVVHVSEHAGEGDADAVRSVLRRARASKIDTEIHSIPGPPAETIRALGDRLAADVFVVGPHRRPDQPAGGRSLGGTARAVAAGAFAPCLIASHPLRLPLERVLVPIDLSDTARGALLVGLSWASALRAGARSDRETTLTVLHVDTPDEDAGTVSTSTSVDRELDRLQRDAGGWAGVAVRSLTLRSADAARAIAECAADQKADLVVVGTRGLGLDEEERLGSVSTSVTTHLQVPVLLVPPAVWRVHAAAP